MGEEPLENPWEKSNLNDKYMGYSSSFTSLRCAILQPYSFCWESAVSVIHDLFRLWTQPLVESDSSAMRFGRGKYPFWGGRARINRQKQVGSESSDECWFWTVGEANARASQAGNLCSWNVTVRVKPCGNGGIRVMPPVQHQATVR